MDRAGIIDCTKIIREGLRRADNCGLWRSCKNGAGGVVSESIRRRGGLALRGGLREGVWGVAIGLPG